MVTPVQRAYLDHRNSRTQSDTIVPSFLHMLVFSEAEPSRWITIVNRFMLHMDESTENSPQLMRAPRQMPGRWLSVIRPSRVGSDELR